MSINSVKQALIYGINELRLANIDSARLDAELLLGFVLGFSREKILSEPKFKISNLKFKIFSKLISKRSKHVPIAYLTGSKEFYGIDFFVNENVLVPRPETELLVEEVLHFVGNRHACSLLELGTGSGCIALALAKYLPKAKIIAADVSEKALAVARRNRSIVVNADLRSLRRIRFIRSNLLSNIKTKPDIIVANLPYLTSKELKERSIAREPKSALYGGKDGLDVYKKMFQQIKSKKWVNLTIFIEIGDAQAKSIRKYIQDLFPKAKIEIKKDLAGKDRVIIIEI